MEWRHGGGAALEHRRWVGMRIIKTVVAVFLCGLLGYARGESAFFSMMAALICIQNSTGKTIRSSVNQALGTLIGGAAGVLVVYCLDVLGILYIEPARYLMLALVLIPIIRFCLYIRKADVAALACMVFLCVTVDHGPEDIPAVYAIQRMFETLVGVGAACAVDLLLPYQPVPAPEEPAPREAAPEEPDPEQPAPGEPDPEQLALEGFAPRPPEDGGEDGEDGPGDTDAPRDGGEGLP